MENKYGIVTNENPTTAISWSPKYALSAGPVLLKDKKIPFDFTETSKGTDYYRSSPCRAPDKRFTENS